MTNVSAVEKMAELMQQMEENSPRVAALQYCLTQLEAKCAALAAENAGLKDEISNITFMRNDDFFGSTQRAQEVMGRLVNVKTPATDAFLAEVRAQGVEMFAKHCQKRHGEMMKSEPNEAARNQAITSTRRAGEFALYFAAQLRKGVQS